MIELQVESDEAIVIRYAGGDPITYQPKDGVVEVEARHVDEFLAAIPSASKIAPPAAELAVEGAKKAEPAKKE